MLALLLAGCHSSIAPGYRIEKLDVEVRFVPTPGQSLHLRAAYRLKNTGNSPLDFLDAKLPAESSLNRRNLVVSLDGQPASVNLTTDTARIPFSSPWPVKSTRALVIEYELAPPHQLTQDAFYLLPGNWYPVLLPPDHLLARADLPDQWDLRVRVPEGFLVHASGHPRGSSRSGSERVHRFTQRTTDDFRPFLLSGRFVEHRFNGSVPVIFWTSQSVSSDDLRAAATGVGASVTYFESVFGPRRRSTSPVWIVQKTFFYNRHPRGRLRPYLPEVAVIHDGEGVLGYSLEGNLTMINLSLADTWLRLLSTPQGALEDYLALDLRAWASLSAEESAGSSGKLTRMRAVLWDSYERARDRFPEISLKEYVLTAGKPWTNNIAKNNDAEGVRNNFAAKSGLFILALEDTVGPKNFRAGLRRMIQARRGLDWTVDDLRSALELESGQNLAEFFRVWLYQPGIPDDFRRRYSSPSP